MAQDGEVAGRCGPGYPPGAGVEDPLDTAVHREEKHLPGQVDLHGTADGRPGRRSGRAVKRRKDR